MVFKRWTSSVFLTFAFVVILMQLCCASLTDDEKKYTRTLSDVKTNPKCNNQDVRCKNISVGSLSYVHAEGHNDDLHHLFSTIGVPTVFMARTDKRNGDSAKLKSVNYPSLFDGNSSASVITFDWKPNHVFGIVFANIYEFNDIKDSANMTDTHIGNAIAKHSLTDLYWTVEFVTDVSPDDHSHVIVYNATSHPGSNNTSFFKKGGYISFRVRYDNKDGRLDTRPHMEHTANSSVVTIVMANLTSTWKNSRFAIEMFMFSDEPGTAEDHNATQVSLINSLDDEYSPGVFQMRNWEANSKKNNWGYAQWKPVMYTSTKRLNADLAHASSYDNLPLDRAMTEQYIPRPNLFNSYFGFNNAHVSLNATNVSFGTTGDKFYQHTNYVVWTMSMGLGPAPTDDVSIMVILVIAVGLGIPLLLLIFSGIFVCIKNRKRDKDSEYKAIN